MIFRELAEGHCRPRVGGGGGDERASLEVIDALDDLYSLFKTVHLTIHQTWYQDTNSANLFILIRDHCLRFVLIV